MPPLISVILPVYNVEPYLRECLDSILRQTYDRLEILLIDDGSTDESGRICDEYARADSRIRVVHQENGGVSAARNRGLDAFTGEYIAWVDPDDVCSTDMLEYLYKGLEEYQADMSQCGVTRDRVKFDSACAAPSQSLRGTLLSDPDALYDAFMNKDIWDNLAFKLYKAALFEGIRIPPMIFGEDTWLQLRLLPSIKRAVLLPEQKYFYRKRADSLTNAQMGASESRVYVEMFRCMGMVEPDLHEHFIGRCYYGLAHQAARSLSKRNRAQAYEDACLKELLGIIQSKKNAMLACPMIGPLGRLEVLALCAGRPWSWRFAAFCQAVYERRADKRSNKHARISSKPKQNRFHRPCGG